MHAPPAKLAFNRFVMIFVLLLFGGGYRRYWQEAELPCHADVIADSPMFDDQAVFHLVAVDWDTVIHYLVGEKFALSCESFLLDGLEHLPNDNFILFYRVHYSFKFGSISV
jgi:hypothetical protein